MHAFMNVIVTDIVIPDFAQSLVFFKSWLCILKTTFKVVAWLSPISMLIFV